MAKKQGEQRIMDGKLIAELGKILEEFGYSLISIETKETEVNIKIQGDK